MVSRLFSTILLSLSVTFAAAQGTLMYQQDAGADLPIYRGRLMTEYRTLFNGTPYWDNGGFQSGTVAYAGKTYYDVLLNVDAARQALYVHYGNSYLPWDLGRQQVEWFTFRGHKFVNLRDFGYPDAPEGFLETLYEGKECVYRQILKVYLESVDHNRYYRIGYEDPDFNESLLGFYEHREYYWYKDADGNLQKFRSRKFLLKKHPAQRKALKRQIKQAKWDTLPMDKYCTEVMLFIENSGL